MKSIGKPRTGRRWLFLGLAAFGLTALYGCDLAGGQRHRVTVVVDVDGTHFSGSSVQEFECHDGTNNMDTTRCMVKGEAVVVDLKARGYLFLTFVGDRGGQTSMVQSLFKARQENIIPTASYPKYRKWAVPSPFLPMMVSFKDANNPKSVVKIDPDHLDQSFGAGVSLKRVTVEETDEPISRGVLDRALPWLKSLNNRSLAGAELISSNELSENLDISSFKKEKL